MTGLQMTGSPQIADRTFHTVYQEQATLFHTSALPDGPLRSDPLAHLQSKSKNMSRSITEHGTAPHEEALDTT